MMTDTAMNQSTASQTSAAYERLRADVISGVLAPGLKLKVEWLQERYPFGITPLRQALGLLISTGLVERVDQRGFRVAPVSLDQFEELLWTRSQIEETALRDAIARGGREWEERIVLALYHLNRTPRPDGERPPPSTEGGWEACHKTFHMVILSACRSQRLLSICEQLYDANSRYRHLARIHTANTASAYAEHKRIADSVLERDVETAVTTLRQHYHRTGDLLRSYLAAASAKQRPAFADAAPAKQTA